MKLKKVYIASPYTLGDVAKNVKVSIDTFRQLLDLGYVPFCPLLTHFVHIIHPQNYDVWLAYDLEWVRSCDALLRLPGDSKGADKEVIFAESINIPVFYTIRELLINFPI